MSNIKFLVLDVDGTLTDGKIYMGAEGEMFKAFDIKDGCGIKDILPQYNIVPVIITARDSMILIRRCKELNISNLYQNCRDKKLQLDKILEEYSLKDNKVYGYNNVAYCGDDILDLQCMKPIHKAGGITGCPADAVSDVKKISDFVSKKNGGNGAVREFIEWICREQI